MRIEQIEIRHVSMPLVHPFETSFGREEARETIIVSVRSDGLTGWGESATSVGPWYEYETVETCWHVLRDFLAPFLVGQQLASPRDAARLMAPVRGHNLAKMGLEAAVWDLIGKSQGVSVSKLLGGDKDRVPVGVSIGVQGSVAQLIERIGSFWRQGYKKIKINFS